MKDGFKHTVILMSASYLICIVAILPLSVATNSYIITPISGDDQIGVPGFKLDNPIVFNVTNMDGKPVPGTQVQFEIKPGGSVYPTYGNTDNSSQVSVMVTLGKNPGNYTITAKAAGSKGSVKIQAKALGG